MNENTNSGPGAAATDTPGGGQMVYCRACGRRIHSSATSCPGCGARQMVADESHRIILPAFLLCLLLGSLGAHRYYVGKIGTGLLMLVTAGGLGIWVLIDLIMILAGSFRDIDGKTLRRWT